MTDVKFPAKVGPSPAPVPEKERVRMSVIEASRRKGDYVVLEHDLEHGTHRAVAKFSRDIRQWKDESGEAMIQDVARIRAITFAQLWEKAVSTGVVNLA